MNLRPHLLVGAALAVWPAVASAQIQTLAKEGDIVPGVGAITRIDNLLINDSGQWVVEADTDAATTSDQVLFREGFVLIGQEGQAMTAPAGATLSSFGGISFNANGDVSDNHFLDGTAGGNDDSGIYWNDVLVLQEGTASTSGAFSFGTLYIGFFSTHIDSSNRITLMASVDDPVIPSSVDRALVVLQVSGSGALLSETVLAKEGDILPGQTEPVAEFGTGPHSLATNDAGSVMFVADLAGDTTVDGAVYVDGTVVAQEGQPSPVPGRNWRTISTSTRLDLNEHGVWAMNGTLDGDTASDLVIVTSNGVVAQEGQNLTAPGFESFVYQSFGSGPICLTDDGQVLYYADWDGPSTATDKGLFLDGELVVQQGVTTVDGVVIQTLRGVQDGYAISPNGAYILFEAVLANGIEGVFMIDRTAQVATYAGCSPTGTSLTAPAGPPVLGGALTLRTSTTTYTAAFPFLAFALAPLDIGGGCGLPIPGFGGELLIDAAAPFLFSTFLTPFTGAPVNFAVPLANDPALAGLHLYAQVTMVDVFPSFTPFEFSNGVHLMLGY